MPWDWLSYFSPLPVEEKAQRRAANRPDRGKREKVKAARKARRRSR